MEIQNKLVVEHVILASVCSCGHVDREEKRIVQRILPVKFTDESRDEAPKDRSREKKKKEQLDATKRVKPIPKVRKIDRLA